MLKALIVYVALIRLMVGVAVIDLAVLEAGHARKPGGALQVPPVLGTPQAP
jgi:hypothetical protein